MKVSDASKAYGATDAKSAKRTPRPIRDAGIGRFAERLKEAMAGQGMRAFAKRCGISEGAIFSYLSSETYPTLDRLDAIAAVSKKPGSWFISLPGASHDMSGEHLNIALELADEALKGLWLPKRRYADLVALIYDGITQGLPYAQIIEFARPAAMKLAKERDDDGGTRVGEAGEGSAGGGKAGG